MGLGARRTTRGASDGSQRFCLTPITCPSFPDSESMWERTLEDLIRVRILSICTAMRRC